MTNEYLPNIGDLYDLGRNGICVCTDINEENRTIQWFRQNQSVWFTQYFHSFRKFLREGWAIKL